MKSMNRYRVSLIVSLGLFFALLIGVSYFLFSFDERHVLEYRTLMENTDNAKKENQAPYTSTQQHRGALKEVLFTKKQRLQMRLLSDDTELVLDHHEGHTEVIERMKNVTCCMQEELFYQLSDGREAILQENGKITLRDSPTQLVPENEQLKPMQLLRYMKADRAIYYYETDRLIAEEVKIQRFIAPGHQLISVVADLKPLMTGIATTVEFSLGSNDFNFVAHELKATLETSKRIK